MNQTSKDTIEFCLEFIKGNVNNASQRTMCRTWVATAIDTVKKEKISSEDFVIGELTAMDDYLSGKNASLTSVDVLTKIDTVLQLI